MKTCKECGDVKALDQYHRNKSMRDGHVNTCKACRCDWQKVYYADNREHFTEYSSKRRAANPEYSRNWYAANPDYQREYAAANPHVRWEVNYRKRTKRYGFEPVVESFTKEQLIARWGSDCWHCGGPFEELDHYEVPVSMGGPHTLESCRPSCKPCNRYSWREDFIPTRQTPVDK